MMRLAALVTAICASAVAFSLIGLHPGSADPAKKYKIFLSMSFTGNDWQAENANML